MTNEINLGPTTAPETLGDLDYERHPDYITFTCDECRMDWNEDELAIAEHDGRHYVSCPCCGYYASDSVPLEEIDRIPL